MGGQSQISPAGKLVADRPSEAFRGNLSAAAGLSTSTGRENTGIGVDRVEDMTWETPSQSELTVEDTSE